MFWEAIILDDSQAEQGKGNRQLLMKFEPRQSCSLPCFVSSLVFEYSHSAYARNLCFRHFRSFDLRRPVSCDRLLTMHAVPSP